MFSVQYFTVVTKNHSLSTMRTFTFAISIILVLLARCSADPIPTTHYVFSPASVWKLDQGSTALATRVNGPFTIHKDASSRSSAVVVLSTEDVSRSEKIFEATLDATITYSSSWNSKVRVGVIPVTAENIQDYTYESLPRQGTDVVSSNLANEVGNKISLDIADSLDDKVRAFELVVVGGGQNADIILNQVLFMLEYPSILSEPIDTGCQRVESSISILEAPGIVSVECFVSADVRTKMLLNGAPTEDGMFRNTPLFLGDAFNVIMLNLPGNVKSGNVIDLPGSGKPWGENVVDAVVEFIRTRDLWNIELVGHDYGSLAADVAHILVPEGRVVSLALAEAVGMNEWLCPSDDTPGCFTDGSDPGPKPNPFMTEGLACNALGIADDVTGNNWFCNQTLVSNYALHKKIAAINGTGVFLSYPAPYPIHVYEALNVKKHDPAFWNAHYCGGNNCNEMNATQAEVYWPRSLYSHDAPICDHNIWTKEFNLRIRQSMESGPLSTIPTTFYCLEYTPNKSIINCRADKVEWAASHYPNFRVHFFGGNMGHFFMDDGFNGAYSFARALQEVHLLEQ